MTDRNEEAIIMNDFKNELMKHVQYQVDRFNADNYQKRLSDG